MSFSSKKRKPEQPPFSRSKQPKGNSKPMVEDIFPFESPNLDTLAPEIKQYVSQLQKQYIQRYNILINNRIIFEEVIENISTELDEKGVTTPSLMELYRYNTLSKINDESAL